MQIHDSLSRLGGRPLFVGLALLLTTLGSSSASRAQEQRRYSPPVEALRRALDKVVPTAEALKEREKTLKELTDDKSQLKTLGDITHALLLPSWVVEKKSTGEVDVTKVDHEARQALFERLVRLIKRSLALGEQTHNPILRAAIVTLIGEFADNARSDINLKYGGTQLLDNLPRFTELLADLAKTDRSPEVLSTIARSLAKLQSDPTPESAPREDNVEPAVPTAVTVPTLQRLLKNSNPGVRRSAAAALANLLRGTRAADRSGGVNAPPVEPSPENLPQFGPQVAKVAGAVLTNQEDDAEVRRLCADALRQVGESLNPRVRIGETAEVHRQLWEVVKALWDQTDALTKATRDPEMPVRYVALRALEEMADVRMHWLFPEREPLKILPSKDKELEPLKPLPFPKPSSAVPGKATGLVLVEAQGPPAKVRDEPSPLSSAIAALVHALGDEDVRIRLAAIDVLEEIAMPNAIRRSEPHPGDPTFAQEVGKDTAAMAARSLTRALSDPDRFVRWAAARALGKMAPLGDTADGEQVQQGAVAALARVLCDRDPDVRLRVALALGQFGEAARPAIPALAEAASKGDNEARIAAVHAIRVIGGHPEVAVPVLADALSASNVRLRRGAAEALVRYGPDAAAATDALNRALSDPDPEVRLLASDALIQIGTGP
jgi:HEAT repeat protein